MKSPNSLKKGADSSLLFNSYQLSVISYQFHRWGKHHTIRLVTGHCSLFTDLRELGGIKYYAKSIAAHPTRTLLPVASATCRRDSLLTRLNIV